MKDKKFNVSVPEANEIIALWFFAIQTVPIFNLFEGQLQKNIYNRCVSGFSAIRENDILWAEQNVNEFVNDFNANYTKRTVGRFSEWLTSKLYGERIKDPVILVG